MSLRAELEELVDEWKHGAVGGVGTLAVAFAIAALIEEVREGNTQLRRIADMLDQASNEVSVNRP